MLAVMSKNIIVAGASGSGGAARADRQFRLRDGDGGRGRSVGFGGAERLGPRQGAGSFDLGAAGSPMVKTVAGRMAASDFTPNFQVRLVAK